MGSIMFYSSCHKFNPKYLITVVVQENGTWDHIFECLGPQLVELFGKEWGVWPC